MKYSSIDIFKFMYFALLEDWNKEKDKNLAIYLSDANPLLCDEGSVDPAVFYEFSKLYGADKELDDYGYSFIKIYLNSLDKYYKNIKNIFDQIPYLKYKEICIENSSYSKEELEKKYL